MWGTGSRLGGGGAGPCLGCRKLVFEGRNFLTELPILELRIRGGSVIGETARGIGRRHGKHRTTEALRHVEPFSLGSLDAERYAFVQMYQYGLFGLELPAAF